MKISKEELITDLQRVRNELGRIPSQEEYQRLGSFGKNTIGRRLGKSWSESILEVFGECRSAYLEQVEIKCENPCCNNHFLSGVGKKRKRFCGVACSNKTRIRRVGSKEEVDLGIAKRERKKRFCKCGAEVFGRKTLCSSCFGIPLRERTLGSFKCLKGANKYGQIREDARKVASGLPERCAHCGYERHVDVCHVKDISSFTDETLIAEINRIENLVKLCKNHHWELDHGFLKLDECSK